MTMQRPRNVGVKAVEVYFPSRYVDQRDLEEHDGVSAGKYVVGLGQKAMSFCDDREDTNSFALTAVSGLLKKYEIDPTGIGRLEVGTETLIDKSKSVKTTLMQLFVPSGNHNILGVDSINACYGGINAFLNAVNWVDSRSWDGRDAIVVAADIAIYDKGPGRPTGGAGAVAMLVGPDAPLAMNMEVIGAYMDHTYDFYKPDFKSEYPAFDGPLSVKSYFKALDGCWETYIQRVALPRFNFSTNGMATPEEEVPGIVRSSLAASTAPSSLDCFDYMCFHSPNVKLVQKSFARLHYLRCSAGHVSKRLTTLERSRESEVLVDPQTDKEAERLWMERSAEDFQKKVMPTLLLPQLCGNMYTASVLSSLATLVSNQSAEQLLGKQIGLFSYGSGLASTLLSLQVVGDTTRMRNVLNLHQRLAARQKCEPKEYESSLALREQAYGQAPYTPCGEVPCLFEGAWYLDHIDEHFRRSYRVKGA